MSLKVEEDNTLQTESERRQILEKFDDLVKSCIRCNSEEDLKLITKAFNLANEAHKGVRRKSGEPYIFHPIAVAKICAQEIGLGAKSIAVGLLHDVVEDTEYTVEDMRNLFGEKIASLIDGLTKMEGVFDKNSSLQAENFRKMLLTLTDDVRVMLIKLADRLHNLRTLESMPRHKQIKIANETIYLYAPLAHRLGLYSIKSELEDLSLKFRFPEVYDDIKNKISETEKSRIQFITKFSLPIIQKLEENNIEFEISGRPKSIYSVWKKMQTKNVTFEEIYDLFAIRIIFEPYPAIPEKTQCWHIYSIITDIYKPKPDRLRDWVSTPKANGYEALHLTVMGPGGAWVEVQVRSRRMDDIAERGFAAHWKYKENVSAESEIDKWIHRIKETLSNPQSDAMEFLDEFKLNLFASEIYVFTPKGDTKTLPAGATALDFAYEIHSGIGNKAIGAKVNHKLAPLNQTLQSGDQIEIITAEAQRPQREWLEFVATAKAKQTIKNALKAETKNRVSIGKQILEEELRENGVKPSSRVFRKLLPAYECLSKDELYSKLGAGLITLENLNKILKKNTQNKWIHYWGLQFLATPRKRKPAEEPTTTTEVIDKRKPFLLKENADEKALDYRIGQCCNPIPGDDVIGFLDKDGKVTVHKTKCQEVIRLSSQFGDKMVTVKWTTHKILSFLTSVSIRGIDRIGIVSELTKVISEELNVNIRKLHIDSHDGIFEGVIGLYVYSANDLNNLIMNVMKIKGIDSVGSIQ
ncbi:RelA/SpoT family protein [Williamwhitmania taraxaci]|uniref:GTP pyrophosphokinase n=1 Tax=Williamwhitmania taraxaci TaxID=1640674 RepID=A0A1G6K5P4_9BACT|nr:RelA/SpoT family protein [Williamwhitmania taraxaci]SDC25636.1 GTP pyrophosphokinase [Williamwhitmania taraxaci]